jgi:hypothetical protein
VISLGRIGGLSDMQLNGKDVVEFLIGINSVRDGRLIGLSLSQGQNEWEEVLHLTFDVPNGTEGNRYDLTLWDELIFDYAFSSDSTLAEIAFVKCLWTEEGAFYLSLDPWKESEHFASEQDCDCFRSKSASLRVSTTSC